MNRIFLLYFIFCISTANSSVIAQINTYANYGNVKPSTPEVAALGKYYESPVGFTTGTPSISIPLYNAKDGKLEVGVSLSYNASGIKVEEGFTWVGLGWSLNTGASLSRIVVGLPDDLPITGFMNTSYTVAEINQKIANNDIYYMQTITNKLNDNSLDTEPDVFMFSAGSYSGKFYYNQQEEDFIFSPYQNIKIQTVKDNDNLIIGFIITTPDGLRYYFGQTKNGDRTVHDKLISSLTISRSDESAVSNSDNIQSINNWHITEIQNDEGDQISFFFETFTSVDKGRAGENIDKRANDVCGVTVNKLNSTFYENTYHKSRLTSIETTHSKLNFTTFSLGSLDAFYNQSLHNAEYKGLHRLELRNDMDELLNYYQFNYAVKESIDAPIFPGLNSIDQEIAKRRLILESLVQFTSNNSKGKMHQFVYNNPEALPSRYSLAQDYWGYYNGEHSNTGLLPAVRYAVIWNVPGGYMPGANRQVNFEFARKGILEKIIYPTGGSVTYEYEPNIVGAQYTTSFLYGFKPSGLLPQTLFFSKLPTYLDPSNPNLYRRNFEINNIDGEVHLFTQVAGCPNGLNNVDCPIQLKIYSATSGTLVLAISEQNQYAVLPNGNYRIEATVSPNLQEYEFNIQINWEMNPDPDNALVGGLRVSKVIAEPIFGEKIIKSFKYHSFEDTTKSSGSLANSPVHVFSIPCGNFTNFVADALIRITSTSASSLGGDDGQSVRYRNVTEFYHDKNDVPTFYSEYSLNYDEYFYTNPTTQPYPFAPHKRRDWRNGLLFNKWDYEKPENQPSRVVAFESNTYHTFNSTFISNFGIKPGPFPSSAPMSENNHVFADYTLPTEWYLPIIKYNEGFSNDAASVVFMKTTQNFDYNSSFQLQKTITSNSKDQDLETEYKYPTDFPAHPVFSKMVSRNQIQQVVSQNQKNLTLGTILSTNEIEYDGWYLSPSLEPKFLKPKVFKSSFKGLPLEMEGEIISYEDNGNIKEIKGKDGIVTTILWGYQGHYPVGKIIGKTLSEVINQSGIDVNIIKTTNSNATLLIEINKLQSLTKCLVTTYTYHPIFGLLTETDPSWKTTYYEYDGFGRLEHIKDQYGNIIKKFCYNYLGEQSDCND